MNRVSEGAFARGFPTKGLSLYMVTFYEVRSDSYLWYRGGDTVGVYDLNWKPLAPLPVVSKNFTAPQGDMDLKISAPDIDPSMWFECQFFVKDSPMIVKNLGK